jgi:hypothetical protein
MPQPQNCLILILLLQGPGLNLYNSNNKVVSAVMSHFNFVVARPRSEHVQQQQQGGVGCDRRRPLPQHRQGTMLENF